MNIKLYKPGTLDEAVHLMSDEGGRIIAGGTDLIIKLRNNVENPEFLVDISSLPELKKIRIEKKRISLGSALTFTDIIDNPCIKAQLPCLDEMAKGIGAVQIQNRATLGGNICNAAPAADSIPLFMCLDAKCIIAGQDGLREVMLREFINDKGKASLNYGEILKEIEFSQLKQNEACGFYKLGKRNALTISTISCAVKVSMTRNRIVDISIYTGSLGVKATREEKTESFLKNALYNETIIEAAADILSEDVAERNKSRASMPYKRIAAKAVFREAFIRAVTRLKKEKVSFVLNGRYLSAEADPSMRLIDFLRDELKLTGTKEGCGQGECGACTVIIDGKTANSCLVLLGQLEGSTVTTIEGLGDENNIHLIQQAFIEEGAVQCGYCTPGMVLSAKALLDKNNAPDETEIKTAISGNLCRCTGYKKIEKAILRASEKMKEAGSNDGGT